MPLEHLKKQVLGLDPLIKCCLRLQVKDILKLKSANMEEFPGHLNLPFFFVIFL